MVTTIWLISGCIRAGGSDGSLRPASQQPSQIPTASPAGGTVDLPASITDPVVAEIARDAGVPVDQVAIVSAAAVTFSDGGLGCPEPGMAYTQVLVDGYKIVAEAGGTTYDYRGSGDAFRRCLSGGRAAPSR